jgi:hypothetical protein
MNDQTEARVPPTPEERAEIDRTVDVLRLARDFGKAAAAFGLAYETWKRTYDAEYLDAEPPGTNNPRTPHFVSDVTPTVRAMHEADVALQKAARRLFDGSERLHGPPLSMAKTDPAPADPDATAVPK